MGVELMDWTIFGFGFLAGAILWDILWRIVNRLSDKLIAEQREYIAELRKYAGLDSDLEHRIDRKLERER